MNKPSISVVISAYNEEAVIGRCLKSVSFADEIVVIDNSSTDSTVGIAKTFTKNVIIRPNKLMLNENKNFGFTKATSDWILNLDADEVIPPELAVEIVSLLKSNPKVNGFWIKRKNFSYGKWIKHGLWWPDKQLRLFRSNAGAFPCVHIHEYIQVEGISEDLQEPYLHYNYESIHQYLLKIDRASSSEALTLRESGYRLAWYDALRFPASDFLKIYFAQNGWKDGLHGLVLAMLQGFYSFCVFAKYWEMEKFPQKDITLTQIHAEIQKTGHDVSYWLLTGRISESKSIFPQFLAKIQRKLLSLRK